MFALYEIFVNIQGRWKEKFYEKRKKHIVTFPLIKYWFIQYHYKITIKNQ